MRHYVAVVLVVTLFMAPCASAGIAARALEMKAGTISVTVKTHDGKALSGAKLTLLKNGAKDKVTVVADKKGQCGLKDLAAGEYTLEVAGRAMLPFTVSEKVKVSELLVVLPAPVKYAAGSVKKTALPTLTTFIIGALAVGTGIVLLSSSGGGSSGGGGHP